jgi:hypothetical protein
MLLDRDFKSSLRNPMVTAAKLLHSIFIGVFMGGLYYYAGRESYLDPVQWHAITGFLFFCSIAAFMGQLGSIALVFPRDLCVCIKERNAEMYSIGPYFISRIVMEIPFILVMSLIFILIVFWMVGLSSNIGQAFQLYLAGVVTGFAGSSVGLLIGNLVEDAKSVAVVAPAFLVPFICFSGYFKNF